MSNKLKWKWLWWWWKFTLSQKSKYLYRHRSYLLANALRDHIIQRSRWFYGGGVLSLVTLLGVLAWGEVYWLRYHVPATAPAKQFTRKPVNNFYWHRLYEVDTYEAILASPLLSPLDHVKGDDILVANTLGGIYAFSGVAGRRLYEFAVNGRVLASPFTISLKANEATSNGGSALSRRQEPFIVTEAGVFYALAIGAGGVQRDYLYRARREHVYNRTTFGKPAYGEVATTSGGAGMVFIAGSEGIVAAYESAYGRLLWTNDSSFSRNDVILVPPVLLDNDNLLANAAAPTSISPQAASLSKNATVVAASLTGTIAAMEALSGKPVATLRLSNEEATFTGNNDGIRSAMNVGNFLVEAQEKDLWEVAVITYWGKGMFFSLPEKVYCYFNLSGFFVSALAKGTFYSAGSALHLLAVSTDGEFYSVRLQLGADNAYQCVVRRFTERPQASFLGAPIVEDFNGDNISDILIASRQGELFLIDGKNGQDLLAPLALGYAVTATPAVGDLTGDGHLEVVLAGENGTLTVLSLISTPEASFLPHYAVSRMFLRDTYNHN